MFLEGTISKREIGELLELSKDKSYRKAIQRLYIKTQVVDRTRDALSKLTEGQQDSPFLKVLASDNPVESLAYYMKKRLRLKTADIDRLTKFNELTIKEFHKYNIVPTFFGIFTVFVAIMALALNAFRDLSGSDVHLIEVSYGFSFGILSYFLFAMIAVIAAWIIHRRKLRPHELCGTLLAYCALLEGGKKVSSKE